MTSHALGNIAKALPADEASALNIDQANDAMRRLVRIYNQHKAGNDFKTKLYEGKLTAQECNLRIAVPQELEDIGVACEWPAIAVRSLQSRSKMQEAKSPYGELKAEFNRIVSENDLVFKYNKAVIPELKHGCAFGTLSFSDDERARIKFHTAASSAAEWDGEHDRLACGFAIIDSAKFNRDRSYKPSVVNLYLPDAIWVYRRVDSSNWTAEEHPHKMGRCLMVPMCYRPDEERPFGISRVSKSVVYLTKAAIRAYLRFEVAAELYAAPQRVGINLDDDTLDALDGNFKAYFGYWLAMAASDEEQDGDITAPEPKIFQLDPPSFQPHVDVLRSLAEAFSATTGVPLNELGVRYDQPSSAEAIAMAKEGICKEAESLNETNGRALAELILMAHLMNTDRAWRDLTEEERTISIKFKNPATPSVSSQADAMVKIANVLDGFSYTRAFLEAMGFDADEIDTIQSELKSANASGFLEKLFEVRTGGVTDGTDDQAATPPEGE